MPITAQVIPMRQSKLCKNSTRYSTDDQSAIADNVYVKKAWADKSPEAVVVIVVPVPPGTTPEAMASSVTKTLMLPGAF